MTKPAPGRKGLILFAHGARDPAWAEPLIALRDRVRAAAPNVPTALAFLELMTPSLADAVAELVDAGCDDIRIVPIFFGRGGHLKHDLPILVERAQAQCPSVRLSTATFAGDDDGVLEALAAFCLRALQRVAATN
jgi:sirohydrochlorin cobaltochelatase